ncbi:uncharacterized protein M6B38_266345 [Iris pallida]|uniref:DUF8039 domain-containing protein n=1 Tax=Iris pallida TaxID=29817 RepID=A0AAX6IB06_IRIPA|nr:uncharacterized protein M6B38_266345 [Iris pallida]
MRAKQVDLVHRTSRKSFAVVEDELKQQSETPEAISRADVWIHAYEARKTNSEGEVQDSDIVQQVKQYKAQEDPSQHTSITNDAVAKVLGPDPRGRVRGFGFGANPSKVDGQIHMGNKVTRLENELKSLKGLVKDLLGRFDKGGNNSENTSVQLSANEIAKRKRKENSNDQLSCNERAKSKQKEDTIGRSSKDESIQNDQGKQKGNKSIQIFASERAQNKKSNKGSAASIQDFGCEGTQRRQHELASGAKGSNIENRMCKLLSWFAKDEVVVATAEIASTDPSALVHHVPLGHDCWKVWVRDVIDDIVLYRPTAEFGKLSCAEQSTIAWPIRYIKLD